MLLGLLARVEWRCAVVIGGKDLVWVALCRCDGGKAWSGWRRAVVIGGESLVDMHCYGGLLEEKAIVPFGSAFTNLAPVPAAVAGLLTHTPEVSHRRRSSPH